MPACRTTPLSIVPAPVTSITPTTESTLGQLALVARLENRSERELRAYFVAGGTIAASNGASPDVFSLLIGLPAHHRGVLGLHYRPRAWSDGVKRAFGEVASLAIRLYLVDHPAVGPTPALEQAAAERVAAIVAAEGSDASLLMDVHFRALEHHATALHAYVKARAKRDGRRV